MRVEQTSIFMGDTSKSERNGYSQTGKSTNRIKGTMFVGKMNQNIDLIAQKIKEARAKAMKVVGDTFAGEIKIDDDLQNRRDHISELRNNMGKAQDELKKIEEDKTSLRESYGIMEDSEEQKDLKLLEKRRDSMKFNSTVSLSDDDKERLAKIDEAGKTEYQSRSLEMDELGYPYRKEIEESQKIIIEENAIIRGVKLERLKTNPILDAKKEADGIMEAASNEIKGMLIEEAKSNIDEEMKQQQETAEKNAKDDKNIIKLENVKTDVMVEVEDIVRKMKLISEDIKGTTVDLKL